jgi:hypothetical protein
MLESTVKADVKKYSIWWEYDKQKGWITVAEYRGNIV